MPLIRPDHALGAVRSDGPGESVCEDGRERVAVLTWVESREGLVAGPATLKPVVASEGDIEPFCSCGFVSEVGPELSVLGLFDAVDTGEHGRRLGSGGHTKAEDCNGDGQAVRTSCAF